MGFRGLFYVIGNSVRISYYIKSSAIYRIAKRYDETKPHNVHSRGKKKVIYIGVLTPNMSGSIITNR